MKKKTVARSSVSGKIVSKKFAKENPSTTQVEIIGTSGVSKQTVANILIEVDRAMAHLELIKWRLKGGKKGVKNKPKK